jgi:glycosyltransferase involved in cell wall biosynthesis
VPSKVLSYLCSARPVLVGIPPTNLAARLVEQHQLGLTVDPRNVKDFLGAAARLQDDDRLRQRFGDNARQYAEQHFDFARICDRFVEILEGRPDAGADHSSSPRSLASTE